MIHTVIGWQKVFFYEHKYDIPNIYHKATTKRCWFHPVADLMPCGQVVEHHTDYITENSKLINIILLDLELLHGNDR